MVKQTNRKTPENFPLSDYYSRIYKRYDLINHLFTFGNDRKWRRIAASVCISLNPQHVIDLCCGTGELTIRLNELSEGKIQVTGYDFSEPMLQLARKKTVKIQAENIEFVIGDAASMPFSDSSFDCMTIAFGFRNLIFNNTNAKQHMIEISRIIKPGGHLLILESSVPEHPFLRFFSRMYLKTILIPLGGIISGNWHAYGYLARSSIGYLNSSSLKKLLSEYNFDVCSVKSFCLGAVNLTLARKV